MDKPKKTPPLLKRDEHNQVLDPGQADRVAKELLGKLALEQRAHEKDQSLHMARTGKRDVMIHLAVTVLGQVNGHPVIGEKDSEYGQWCVRFNASHLPLRNSMVVKAIAELAHIGKSAMMKLGMVLP